MLSDKEKSIELGKEVAFFIDSTNQISNLLELEKEIAAGNLAFSRQSRQILNLGNLKATVWLRLEVEVRTPAEWVLELDAPLLDYLEFYAPSEQGHYLIKEMGAYYPFSQRFLKVTSYILPLHKEVGKRVYYLKIKSDFPLELPLTVSTQDKFLEENHKKDLFFGMYAGFMLSMLLYYFFLFLRLGDKSYLYYALYISLAVVFYLHLFGYSFEILWANRPIINFYTPTMSCVLVTVVMILSSDFLESKKNTPMLHKGYYIFGFLFFLIILINLSGNFSLAAPPSQTIALLGLLYTLTVGIVGYWKGNKTARFFILAWSFYGVSAIIFILKVQAVLSSNIFTKYSIVWGSASTTILLAFALADKIYVLRKEKGKIEQDLILSLQENEKLVQEKNKDLERQVHIRTEELQQVNDELHSTLEFVQTQKEELEHAHQRQAETLHQLDQQSRKVAKHNQDMLASINYGKRIQEAMLPFEYRFESIFGQDNFFVLYQPRDVVSGDFYWLHQLQKDDKKMTFVAILDCTGHGVPGAFMSMIGNQLLYNLVESENLVLPNQILTRLNQEVKRVLKQDATQNRDGMDAALIALNWEKRELQYAGAMISLFYVSPEGIAELKATKQSIGGWQKREIPFEMQTLSFETDLQLWLATDGFQDQFGGKDYRKFMKKRLKELLFEIRGEKGSTQKMILTQTLQNWISEGREAKQTDDITIIGINLRH